RLSYFCPIGRQLATSVKDSFLPSELGGAAVRHGHTEGATVELVDAAKCLLIARRLPFVSPWRLPVRSRLGTLEGVEEVLRTNLRRESRRPVDLGLTRDAQLQRVAVQLIDAQQHVTFGLAVQGLQVNGLGLLGGVHLDAILLLVGASSCNEDHSVRPCESQLYGLDFVGGDGLAIQCKDFHGLPIAFQLVPILGGVTTMDSAKPKEKGYKHENRRRRPHDPACFHGLTTKLSSRGRC